MGFLLPMLLVLSNLAKYNGSVKIEIKTLMCLFELGDEDYSSMTEGEAKQAKQARHMRSSTPPTTIGRR